jgi:hypothetical protein
VSCFKIVGISAVLFALKTVLNLDPNSPRDSIIYGIRLPTRYVAWAELLIIQLLVPNASFAGHLAGIVAGLLWVRPSIKTFIYHSCSFTIVYASSIGICISFPC